MILQKNQSDILFKPSVLGNSSKKGADLWYDN